MNILNAENVYETLIGSLLEEYGIPGVKNAYADGSLCNGLYQQIYRANCRLCARWQLCHKPIRPPGLSVTR